jgi:amino acid transporter
VTEAPAARRARDVGGGLPRRLGLLSLAAVIFFNVSGGPYGIEDTVSTFGPGLALLLLILTPLVWSLPVALVMSELAAAIPDEGGYVAWVRRAFGPFWSFQVGWWSWVDSFVDVAVYPALFVEYARLWWPDIGPVERWLLALVFIWGLTLLNVLGVRLTGRAAVVCAGLCLAPVLVFALVSLLQVRTEPWLPWFAPGHGWRSFGFGLAVVMWNYSGWDTPATVLGETRGPERAFPAATGLSLAVITLAYLLPIGAALGTGGDWRSWKAGALPLIAAGVGGPLLGHFVGLGAVTSAAGLFLSLLLTNSRLPYVLARDGQLASAFGAVHHRFATPWVAVVVSAALYSVFVAFSFQELIVINMWLYSLSLLVELAAFLRLRQLEPRLPRPYRVPGGRPGAFGATVPPAACALLAMATAGTLNTVVGLLAALSGPVVWMAFSGSRR